MTARPVDIQLKLLSNWVIPPKLMQHRRAEVVSHRGRHMRDGAGATVRAARQPDKPKHDAQREQPPMKEKEERVVLRKYSELEEPKLPRGWTIEEFQTMTDGRPDTAWRAVHRQHGVSETTTTKVKAMLAAWRVHNAKVLSDR